MKPLIAAGMLLVGAWTPASAQSSSPKIALAVEALTEGKTVPEGAAARLFDDVRRGLEALSDVQLVAPEQSPRMISIVAGVGAGPYAASVLVTERHDRDTLMSLGIEDDDLAARMMALRVVNDHQLFTGADLADMARRIVASLNTGILARLRALRPKQ